MRRKILIAEQADTVRSIAETVLRQSGYDVIAVTAAEKAREVLELSRPDLIIVGADLMAPDGSPFYEKLRTDPRSAKIPVLFFQSSDKSELPFPSEVIIPRPFDPKQLLSQVAVFMGTGDKVASAPPGSPTLTGVDDDFLDAALGLDDLKITESEVLNQTSVRRQPKNNQAGEKLIGLEGGSRDDDTGGTSVNVESLVLDEASGRAVRQIPGRKAPSIEGTGKLDILTDQYGMVAPQSAGHDGDTSHDYNWFVDAIRKDNDPAAAAPRPQDSGKLPVAPRSETVDPVTNGPGAPATSKPASGSAGVEKFIDEFKKEMEQIRDTDSERLVPDVKTIGTEPRDKLGWEEKLEKLGPGEMEMFIREFSQELGRRVAEIIAAKIDPEKLLRLIKDEIVERRGKGR